MSIATLSIDLEAKFSKLEDGLTKAERAAAKSFDKIKKHTEGFEAAMTRAAGVLSGVLAGSVISQGFLRAIQGLDALNDAADATGSSVSKLSALEDFGLRTGTAFSTVTDLLVKFNGELSKATPGSAAEQALAAIGLRAEELRSLDPADALQKTAQALSGYADDGNKARLVQELFGKSVREAAPFLKDLAEAGALQATVTNEQAEAAERYLKATAQLEADLSQLGRTVASQVAPVFSRFVGEFRDGIEVFGSFGAALLNIGWGTSPFDTMAETMAKTREQIALLKAEAADLQKRIANPVTTLDRLWAGGRNAEQLKALQQDIDAQEKLLQYLNRRQAAGVAAATYSNEARQPGLPSIKRPVAGKSNGAAAPARSTADPLGAFIEDIEARQRVSAKLDAEYQREFERRQAEIDRRIEQFKDFGDQLSSSTVDINASLIDDDRERGLVQIELDRQVMQRRLNELQLFGEQRERLQAQLDENIAARQRALEESLKPAWQRMVEGWSDTTRHMADSYEVLMDGVVARTEDALTRMIRDGKLSIGDLADFVQDAIARMVAQKAVAKLLEIGDVLFGGGLGGGFAKGAAFQGGSVVPFATGGVVSSPTYFPMSRGRTGLMGEAGPEAILPLRRGPDGRLGVQSSAQQAGPTVVVNIASGITSAELAAMVPMLKAQIKAELQYSARRPGGML